MADIAVNPFDLKDVDFLVAADNYKAHLSAVRLEPSSSTSTWKGLAPAAVFTFGTKATWTCVTEFAQDWTTVDSFSQYLLEHEGEEVEVTFRPRSGETGFTVTLILAAPPIGGTVDQPATGSVTHGCKGKPVLVPAT